MYKKITHEQVIVKWVSYCFLKLQMTSDRKVSELLLFKTTDDKWS